MARFEGKAVVITGGSGGIGLATARRIVAEGGRALVTGTNAKKLAAVRSDFIHILVNDAADPLAATTLAAEARSLFGSIDGAFLNAGVGAGAPLDRVSVELYRKLMDLNVGGVLFGAQALAPLLGEGGSILVTASSAKDQGLPMGAVYSATKGAVRSMVRGLAAELAPRGIRVNTISPGPIASDFFDRIGYPPEQTAQMLGHIAARNPLGRVGTTAEAAAVAAFLLSAEAGYVTGSDYAVDGGEAQL